MRGLPGISEAMDGRREAHMDVLVAVPGRPLTPLPELQNGQATQRLNPPGSIIPGSRSKNLAHRLPHRRRRNEYVATIEIGWVTFRNLPEMPGGGAGFQGNEAGGGEVPGTNVFVVDVQAPTGDPADIEGGRADAAQVAAPVDHGVEAPDQRLQVVLVIGEAGGEQ